MTKMTHEDRILGALLLADLGGTPGAATELWEIVARFGGLADLFRTPTRNTFAGANNGKRGRNGHHG